MPRLALLLVALLCIADIVGSGRASAAERGFAAGLSAYNAGEFERAAEIWSPLAEAGDKHAQSGLGLLYYSGFGVPRDFDRARALFLAAAEKGVVQAQMFLSLMYFKGDGVRRDYKLAYMWSDIAVAAGYDQAADFKARVAESLTPQEVREAAKLASDWQAFHAGR